MLPHRGIYQFQKRTRFPPRRSRLPECAREQPASPRPGPRQLPGVQAPRAAPDPQAMPVAPAPKDWPDLPAPSALPPAVNARASRAAPAGKLPYASPEPVGAPGWTGLPHGSPPAQPPAPGLAQPVAPYRPEVYPGFASAGSIAPDQAQPGGSSQTEVYPGFPPVQPFATERAQPGGSSQPDLSPAFPPVQLPATEQAQPPAPDLLQGDSSRWPSDSWPELPDTPAEEDGQDRVLGDFQQQLERRWRMDQEQRGGPWNM